MLLNTYKKVMDLFESGNGYRDASELKDAKITTVQIKELVNMGIIERVSHGHYWLVDEENGKPENYKMIEACMLLSWLDRCGAGEIVGCHIEDGPLSYAA